MIYLPYRSQDNARYAILKIMFLFNDAKEVPAISESVELSIPLYVTLIVFEPFIVLLVSLDFRILFILRNFSQFGFMASNYPEIEILYCGKNQNAKMFPKFHQKHFIGSFY